MFAGKTGSVSRFEDLLPEVRQWFNSDQGQFLLAAEQSHLRELLPRMFGQHACTLGILPDSSLLDDACIVYKTFLTPLSEETAGMMVQISVNEWGIQPRSMNMVLLHHVLDFAERPHRILREACRSIVPGGKLVIVGFNPYSIWNPLRMLGQGENKIMQKARFYQSWRLKDWLTLLNFRTTELRFGGGLFPFTCGLQPARKQKLEHLVSSPRLGLGSFYVLVAVKERAGLIPYDRRWRSTGNQLLGSSACCSGSLMEKPK